jgi:hypothetical protein
MKTTKRILGKIKFLTLAVFMTTNSLVFTTNGNEIIGKRNENKALPAGLSDKYTDFRVRYKGYFVLSDNDEEIVGISPNGYLEISRSTFGNKRTLLIKADEKGNLTREYYVSDNEQPFSPGGEKWLADVLPELVRETGIAAEFRVKNIYSKKGMDGLLDEIEEIDEVSRSVRNLYFNILVDQLELNDRDLRLAISKMKMVRSNSTKGTLMRNILYKHDLSETTLVELLETTSTLDYNTERGSVLRVLNPELPQTGSVLEAYFDIIREMSINSEKGNVLKHLLKVQELKPATMIKLIESLSSFSSEREKGAILIRLTDYIGNNNDVIRAFSEIVENMDPDYFILKGEVMAALADRTNKNRSTTNSKVILQLIQSAMESPSNSQKGMTLRKVNRNFSNDRDLVEEYFDLLEKVTNNLEKYNVLLDLLYQNSNLSDEVYEEIFEAAEDLLDDDFEHATGAVLRATIDQMPMEAGLIDDFFDIVQSMDQNSTIEEILRLVAANKDFLKQDNVVSEIIESTDEISVDIEKAAVLMHVKPYIQKTGEAVYAYKDVAEDFDDYHYRKVMAGIER